jgi:hypothetical protein
MGSQTLCNASSGSNVFNTYGHNSPSSQVLSYFLWKGTLPRRKYICLPRLHLKCSELQIIFSNGTY